MSSEDTVHGTVPLYAAAVILTQSLVGLHSRLDPGWQQHAGVGAVIARTRMLCCFFAALHGVSALIGMITPHLQVVQSVLPPSHPCFCFWQVCMPGMRHGYG